ncbi:MAG: hypothetical protein LBE75_06435 [Burkholderiales bacterium]|jgi:hypothetical protein|nr:hypothetical protein [Burkholderiales bacterium]
MKFTQDDLTRINRAIATGERVVQFSDKRIEYRSIDELIRVRNQIAEELAAGKGVLPSRIKRIAHGGKGV